MHHSKYQLAIFDWVKNSSGNALVKATAGSGKTTTCIEALRHMDSGSDKLFLAFNKKIATELQHRISSMNIQNAKGATFHSVGLENYRKSVAGRLNVSNSKVYYITQKYCDAPHLKFASPFIQKLVGFAKDAAFGVRGQPSIDDTDAWLNLISHQDIILNADISLEDAVEIAKNVLRDNNDDTKNIDFGDMIYFPLLFQVKCTQYDWVIVDEAQDTNAARKLFLAKIKKPAGRMLIVGDENQACYGFTGCDADSMDLLKDMFDCIELPLSICYRCGKNIISEAQKYVPEIEAWEGAADGEVSSISYNEFLASLPTLGLTNKDGIICRNNAPNVSLAFALIRQGIGCHIEGKEIGQNLITLCNKWKVSDLPTFAQRLTAYFDREMAKANRAKLAALEDKLETMVILMNRCIDNGDNTVAALKSLIENMFQNASEMGDKPNVVTLSSIHKSKGLQFERVFCIGNSQYIPSRYATQEHQLVQETNLLFIAVTRAISKLTYVYDVPSRSREENIVE